MVPSYEHEQKISFSVADECGILVMWKLFEENEEIVEVAAIKTKQFFKQKITIDFIIVHKVRLEAAEARIIQQP